MAVQIIAFPVVARQNTNDDSTAFGKWFLTPYWPETLNLRGLIELRFLSRTMGTVPDVILTVPIPESPKKCGQQKPSALESEI